MNLRINLGAGGNILPGWINTDLSYADPSLRVDITKPLPWPDNSAETVLAEHVVEHVSGPNCLRLFDEVYRVLQPNGVLRVCVPAIDQIHDLALCRDDIVNHGHEIFFGEATLSRMLKVAGFKRVIRSTRKPCDGHHLVIGKERDDAETLRMEATKA